MKFGQFVVAFALALNSIPGFAAQVGPELTHADLEALASNQNLVKDDLILWPTDQTALTNIKLALHYMTYPHPIFVATEAPSEYRYQVNADDELKIKEISLEGAKVTDVSVFFKSTGAARWGVGYGNPDVNRILPRKEVKNPYFRAYEQWSSDNNNPEFKYEDQITADGNMWMVSLFDKDGLLKEINLVGDSTLRIHGTTAKGFSSYENEYWFYSSVTFNLTRTPIQKHLTEDGKVILFIQGR